MIARKDIAYRFFVALMAAAAIAAPVSEMNAGDVEPATTAEASVTAVPDGAETAQAFAELLATMQSKSALFTHPRWGPRNDDTVAEGRLMLLHMLNHSLDIHLDARYSYRISGNIGGATYTSFAVELSEGGVGATLNDAGMNIADDGSYEIIVSAEAPASGNWLRLDPNVTSITTRHYYETERNVGSEPGFAVDMRIEPLNDPGASLLPTDASVASGIRRVTRCQLAPEEALVITGRFPDCRFANVVLWNDYLQTLPYRYRQISLNREQILLERDGSFRVIIAHRDPDHPNWLDTGGREEGVVFWRFMLPTEPVTALKSELVSLSEP